MNDYTLVNDGIFAQNYNETGNIYVTKSQQAVLLHSTQGNCMGEKIVWQQKIASRLFKDIWFIMIVPYG